MPWVVQPRRNTSSASSGPIPAPVSATRSSSSPDSVRAVTVTSARAAVRCAGTGPPAPPVAVSDAASTALSIRLPRIVTRSRGASERGRAPSSIRLSSASTSSTPRSWACAALPSSRAASTGSATAPTTRSVRTWASSSSAVAKSTASSTRPSSISETTVCSRFAASCACERSAWVKPRSESSSPDSACSSVWSRRVTTVPRRSPPTTGLVLTTMTRSAVRWTSSTRGSEARSAPVSGAGRASSSTRRPTEPGASPSSSLPASLIRATLRCPSSISSPSRTACRVASWYVCIRLSSRAFMPCVCRRSRALITYVPSAPSARATPAAVPRAPSCSRTCVDTRSTVMPALTRPTILSPSRTGVTTRIEGPSVPV